MHVFAARVLRTLLQCALLGSTLLFAAAPAFATVYKCVDANARVTYSSEPCGKQAQQVDAPISVTPPFVVPDTGAGKSGVLDKLGLGSTDVASLLLFALLPLSFFLMFAMSRKSQSRK